LAKYFTIAGFVAGEVYMVYVALAPNLKGEVVPMEAAIHRVLGLSLFFGPFGAAIGLGIWMLVLAIQQSIFGVPPLGDGEGRVGVKGDEPRRGEDGRREGP
jgi:hypothetical protein